MIRKNAGYSIVFVVCVLVIVSLLGMVALTLASSTYSNTIYQYKSEQAYFTARSAADTIVKYIQKYHSDSNIMNALMTSTGTGNIDDMGNYRVNVSYADSNNNKIKISSSATFRGVNSNVVVYLSKSVSSYGIVPTDYALYVDGNVNVGTFNPGVVNGAVYVNGNFGLSYGSEISGKLIATGNINITNGSATTNGIIGFGDVTLSGGGSVIGDALVKGKLTFGGGTTITGNVKCDGDLTMPQGRILGDATTGGSVTFSGGTPKIDGDLNYMGSLSYAYGIVSDWVKGTVRRTSSYISVNLDEYTASTLPIIPAPQLTNNVTMTNKKISSSGILSDNLFSSLSYGDTVTIDTSAGDIRLLVKTDFNPQKGLKFVVTGNNNVYIYLTGNSSFTVGSNQFIGMNDKSLPSNIFIIGDGEQSVSLTNCELNANIYLPRGSFSASGGAPSTYMLQGTCIANSVNIASQISINYSRPNIAGTPLDVLLTGGSGSESWVIERWAAE